MTDSPLRIVVVGSTMLDQIAYAERLPDDGETLIGRSYQIGFGGKGANQAVAAARFGAMVAMVNAVGDDDTGTATIANFVAEGIAVDHVVRRPGPSGVAPIWVDDRGTNRIICVPGANDLVPPELAEAAVMAVRPAVVIGQHEIPQAVTAVGFAAARAVGALTILNPAPAAAVSADLLAVTDWLVPNETEFAILSGTTLTGDAATDAATLEAFGRGADVSLLVTLGGRGVAVVERGHPVAWVAAPAVEVVDTTGAGDAFVGAFAVGLAMGLGPDRAARLGCAAASDSVTRPGTQRSFADRDTATAIVASVLSEPET